MLLGCDNPRARAHAEVALVKLSIENANRVLIIKKLVDMLQVRTYAMCMACTCHACTYAWLLLIKKFVHILQDSGEAAQEQAAAALANLARDSADNRKSIVQADGIAPLLSLLSGSSVRAKENAMVAVTQLCRKSKENQGIIMRCGGIAKLVGVVAGVEKEVFISSQLSKDDVSLYTATALAIKEAARGNHKNQDAVAEAGVIPSLVAILGSWAAQMQASVPPEPEPWPTLP